MSENNSKIHAFFVIVVLFAAAGYGCGSVPSVNIYCDGDVDQDVDGDAADAEPEPREPDWCRKDLTSLSGASCNNSSMDLNAMLTDGGFPPQNAAQSCPRFTRKSPPVASVECQGECDNINRVECVYEASSAMPFGEDGEICRHMYAFKLYPNGYQEDPTRIKFNLTYSNASRCKSMIEFMGAIRPLISYRYTYDNGRETVQAALYDNEGKLFMAVRNGETLCPGDGITITADDVYSGLMPATPFYGFTVDYQPDCDGMCYEINHLRVGSAQLPYLSLPVTGLKVSLDGSELQHYHDGYKFDGQNADWYVYVPIEVRAPVCTWPPEPFTSGECITTRPGITILRDTILFL